MAQWIASQVSSTAIRDCLPGGQVMNLLFNFSEGSNEETMGRQQKEEVLRGNVGKRRSRERSL